MNTFLRKSLFALPLVCFVFACEEPEDGLDGKDAAPLLFTSVNEPSGGNCQSGGAKIAVGTDINANNALDQDEIQKTFFVCNGADGAAAAELIVENSVEPAGENCSSGGIRLLIGSDANGSGTLETEEIQQVSFICNGENAVQQGKTYLILSGDITDAEAQEKIGRELGENTQFVWIVGTTLLTTVDLGSISELAELRIEDNQALKSVSLPNISHVWGDIEIHNNSLETLDIQSLESVSEDFYLDGNRLLSEINLANLRHAKDLTISANPDLGSVALGNIEASTIDIGGNAIASLDLSALTEVPDLSLLISEADLGSVNLSNLTAVKQISLTSSEKLTVLTIGKLTSAGGVNVYDCPLLETVSAPLMSSVGSLALHVLPSVQALDFSALESVGTVDIFDNAALVSVDLSRLVSSGGIRIFSNASLSTLDLGAWSTLDFGTSPDPSFAFNNNAFSSVTVNYLLNLLVNLDPSLTNASILLDQNGSAPPTGDGLVDKASLEGNGNSVSTDV